MSWQKCPICNGSGNDPFIVTGSMSYYPCPTCKGTRLISELTGIPPVVEEKHNIFESLTSSIQNPNEDKKDDWEKELHDKREIWRQDNPEKIDNLFNSSSPATD